jgi:hypothetical protein
LNRSRIERHSMTDSSNVPNGEITKRLDLLIFLQLDARFPSVTEKIAKLAEAGLNSSAIASMVGKKANYVTAVLSQRSKQSGRGGRKATR